MLWGLFSLIGMLVTHVLVHGPVQSVDRGVEVWFAARRTGVWNSVTMFGADMTETQVAIAVTVVVVLLLRWHLGRWYESWIMVAAMVGELLVFYSVTATVHRPRPQVVRLDVAPPTSSFPSGHTAAAVALYGCIAILVFWIYSRRPVLAVSGRAWLNHSSTTPSNATQLSPRTRHYRSDLARHGILSVRQVAAAISQTAP